MKNTIKFLGLIALVVVIGFSFAACGEKEDGGGSISWVGTWQKEGGNANDTFTLGANGNGWGSDGDPLSTADGEKWEAGKDPMEMGFGPALVFKADGSIVGWYYYERISSTKIRITQGGNSDNTWNGVWEKK